MAGQISITVSSVVEWRCNRIRSWRVDRRRKLPPLEKRNGTSGLYLLAGSTTFPSFGEMLEIKGIF